MYAKEADNDVFYVAHINSRAYGRNFKVGSISSTSWLTTSMVNTTIRGIFLAYL